MIDREMKKIENMEEFVGKLYRSISKYCRWVSTEDNVDVKTVEKLDSRKFIIENRVYVVSVYMQSKFVLFSKLVEDKQVNVYTFGEIDNNTNYEFNRGIAVKCKTYESFIRRIREEIYNDLKTITEDENRGLFLLEESAVYLKRNTSILYRIPICSINRGLELFLDINNIDVAKFGIDLCQSKEIEYQEFVNYSTIAPIIKYNVGSTTCILDLLLPNKSKAIKEEFIKKFGTDIFRMEERYEERVQSK